MVNFLKKYQVAIILSISGFSICFLTAWVWLNVFSTELHKILELNSGAYELQKKYELSLIYIGSSTCGPSNHMDLPPAFIQIQHTLEKKAKEHGYGFKTIGIAKEIQITDGLVHLAEYGSFDEVLVGNNWSNLGLIRYIYDEIPGKAATPQLLVTRRSFKAPASDNSTIYRGLENEILLMRKIGFREIIDWSKMGSILPTDSFIE